MLKRVSDIVMEFIQDKVSDTVFLVSGGGISPLTDALANTKLAYVCMNNEQAVTMAADGYAKIESRIGVALVTSGPGALNAITGVVGAWQDSSKLFVISGQCNSATLANEYQRQGGVQEADVMSMLKKCTVFSHSIRNPQETLTILEAALFYMNCGNNPTKKRPGPVWIEIPLDIQSAMIETDIIYNEIRKDVVTNVFNRVSYIPTPFRAWNKIIDMFTAAKYPVVLAGNGVNIDNKVFLFRAFLEQYQLPLVTTRGGITLLNDDHPLNIGRVGIKGTRAGNYAVQNADLLLCIGTSLHINHTGYTIDKFAPNAKKIIVNTDIQAISPLVIKGQDMLIEDQASYFLIGMVKRHEENKSNIPSYYEWRTLLREKKQQFPVVLSTYKYEKLVNTYYFIKKFSEIIPETANVVIDSGSSSYVVSQAFAPKKYQKYVFSGGLGAMGYAVPASIGAYLSNFTKTYCITGDGSFLMNVQELAVIAHHKFPIKIIIFNNKGYASIMDTQKRMFNSNFIAVDNDTGLSLGNICKIAKSFDLPVYTISKTKHINKTLQRLLLNDYPAVISVECDPKQEIIPTVYSIKKGDSIVSTTLDNMYPFIDKEE